MSLAALGAAGAGPAGFLDGRGAHVTAEQRAVRQGNYNYNYNSTKPKNIPRKTAAFCVACFINGDRKEEEKSRERERERAAVVSLLGLERGPIR